MTELLIRTDLAFNGFRLNVDHGFSLHGITALFGHSGSGKSTLLRIVAGLERGASGHVTMDGDIWLDSAKGRFVEPHRRGVGYVFQDARLFDHLSVDGNLRFAERRSRGQGKDLHQKDVIGALDLQPLLAKRVSELSGGERQRVAIGRTLLSRPRLLLLDEPLSALDGRRKNDILPYIAQLPGRFGIPIIYVTHAIEEVVSLADRMVVLSAGKVAASGPVSTVLERLDLAPLTGRFEGGVAMDAVVTAHDGEYQMTRLAHAGQSIVVPKIDVAVGQGVRLRIRARDVSLAIERPNGISIRNILTGTVRQIAAEPDTAFAEVLVDLAGSGVRARVTRLAVEELGLFVGQPVFVLIKSIALDRPAQAYREDASGDR